MVVTMGSSEDEEGYMSDGSEEEEELELPPWTERIEVRGGAV